MTEAVAKAWVFATDLRGLLVFAEPDFPHVGLQVPGGTLDAGETPKAGAAREFAEETGLPRPAVLTQFATSQGEKDGRPVMRHAFHTALPHGLPDNWDHWERTPSSGGAPILFRFGFVPLAEAAGALGGDQGALIGALRTHLDR